MVMGGCYTGENLANASTTPWCQPAGLREASFVREKETAVNMEKKPKPQKKAIKCFFILTKFVVKGGWEKG